MDIKSKEERSRNMAGIRSKDTKPEMFIRSLLHSKGYRFRVNNKDIFGKPDIYFSKKQIAVFIHGCYWHRHMRCKYSYTPKSNVEFWQTKFNANILRDKTVKSHLQHEGIHILIIWECTIKKMMRHEEFSNSVFQEITAFFNDTAMDYQEL